MKSQKGMTLVEVVIAIGVLGIIAAAITTYFTWSLGVFNRSKVGSIEESLARSQMEKIKNDPFSPSGIYTLVADIPAGYSVSGNNAANPTLFGADVAGADGLQIVTVVVTRTYYAAPGGENQRTESVTLQGYKLNR